MTKLYEKLSPWMKVYSLHGDLSTNAIILIVAQREDQGQDVNISVPSDDDEFHVSDEVKEAFTVTQAIDWDAEYKFTAVEEVVSRIIVEISTSLKGNDTRLRPSWYFVMTGEEACRMLGNEENNG
jgi:hypothetical protein